MGESAVVAALAVVAGMLAGVSLARSKAQSLIAWGLLAVSVAVLLQAT